MSSKYKKNNFLNKKRSTKAEEESENSNEDINANEEANNNSDSSDKKTSNKIPSSNKDKKKSESENVILNSKKRLSVRKFKGQIFVDLREFFEKDGKTLPTKKGIALTVDLWNKIKQYQEQIDDAITNMK